MSATLSADMLEWESQNLGRSIEWVGYILRWTAQPMRTLRPSLVAISFSVVACGNVLGTTEVATAALPQDAYEVIAQIGKAAEVKDYTKLRSLLVDEFTWSFGGDVDANQAVTAWREENRYLRELQTTLKRGCHKTSARKITCPGKGGFDFRAGFIKTKAGWRMEYFVEGD